VHELAKLGPMASDANLLTAAAESVQ
jgi:hypothetical protein